MEQKNHTHFRELLGKDRLASPALPPLLIELRTLWSDQHNLFLPTLKLLKKERAGSKIRRPYERRARAHTAACSKTNTFRAPPGSRSKSGAPG